MEDTSPRWEQSLKNLESEFRRLVQALDLLVELDRRIFQTTLDLDALLEEMLKGLRDLVRAEYAQILLRRGPSLVIVHSTQPEDKGTSFRLEECVCGIAVEERRTISSGNVERDFPDRYQWILGRDEADKMISEVAVPIITPAPDQIVSGVINIESPHYDAFSGSETETVERFALQAGAAINNYRIHAGLALAMKLAESIQASSKEPEVALRNTLEQLSGLFQTGVIVQFLKYDRSSDSLTIESSTVQDTEGKNLLVNDSFSGLVIQKRVPVRSNDVQRDYPEIFKDTVGDVGHSPTMSELAVPVKEDGRIVGVINIESPQKDAFSAYDEYMLALVASNASVWTRIYRARRTLALEKMVTVGHVVGHLIHTLNSGLMPLEVIAKNLEQVSNTVDPTIHNKLAPQIDWLRSIAPSIEENVTRLQERYDRAPIRDEGVNINEMALEAAEELVTRDDIQIKWELANNMPRLRVSGGIYDVFWNLISNAKAAIKEGESGQITIGTKITYGQYTQRMEAFELYVEDTGEGIPEDKLDQILQLSYSTKEGHSTGYGLWWVKTFIEMWEGKITIHSVVGEGTSVHIWFPLTSEGDAVQLTEDNEDV